MCVDYRELNKRMKMDAYPLPKISEMLEIFGEAHFFSTLDIASSYWQLPMSKKDQEKIAFTSKYGLYQFTVMPFGLCNAPATYQRFMDQILAETNEKFTAVYMDDIIVSSKTFEEYLQHLYQVFKILRKAGIKCGKDKCFFVRKTIPYLGYVITPTGIKPNNALIEKVKNFLLLRNILAVRRFLDLTRYYRKFIRDYANI